MTMSQNYWYVLANHLTMAALSLCWVVVVCVCECTVCAHVCVVYLCVCVSFVLFFFFFFPKSQTRNVWDGFSLVASVFWQKQVTDKEFQIARELCCSSGWTGRNVSAPRHNIFPEQRHCTWYPYTR